MGDFDRVPWVPIKGRRRLEWPGGARVALWVCPNLEHYEFIPPPPRVRDPWPRMPHPDILGYGTKDYGNRVGFWRMLEVFDRHPIKPTVALGLANFEHYPQIMDACLKRDWDYVCHGIYNTDYLWNYPEDEERAYIADCIDSFRRLTGRKLAGWFSPALSHTVNTPELGIKYFSDLLHDDQPLPLRVKNGRLITVPYSMELNDGIMSMRGFEGADFLRMIKDTFDTLWREGAEQGRVMCIALHPYWVGQPHRIRLFRQALEYIMSHSGVWVTTGGAIVDHFNTHHRAAIDAHLAAREAANG